MSTRRIELSWDENAAYAYNTGWRVSVHDLVEGDSSSFAGPDPAGVVNDALVWLGVDVEVVRR